MSIGACSIRFSIEIEGANALEFSDGDADDEELSRRDSR